jgi:transcriptional regulator with XRE-family HTH domain
MRLGTQLSRIRLQQGLTQAALGKKIGVSQATICNWENNKGGPDEMELARIERVLGKLGGISKHTLDDSDRGSNELTAPATDGRLFGDWLRKAREAAGMAVFELAQSSGVSQVQIYNLEAGRSTNPREETRRRLEKALKTEVPSDVQDQVAEERAIEGLGPLTDFDPHDNEDRPKCPGVYAFYDVSDRPVYVGKSKNISSRVASHEDKFWFKYPIVNNAAYVEIKDKELRHQVEQVLIKFLKSNAVINKQSVDRD